MHDITERRQVEEERLRRAAAEASEHLLLELRYVLTHARCLLWHGTVTDWGRGPGAFSWSTQVFDEAAAQEFFALDVGPGESYTMAWYRHRLPEGQALTDRLSTESLRTNAPHYSAEFGCRCKDGRVGWFDERFNRAGVGDVELPRRASLVFILHRTLL
jgi:PAS domain-containing protein